MIKANKIKVNQYDKNDNLLGPLLGVIDFTLDYNAETDTRKAATLSAINDNYIDFSSLEITIIQNEKEYNLGKFIVKKPSSIEERYLNGKVDKMRSFDITSIAHKLITSWTTHDTLIKGTSRLVDALAGSGCDDGVVHFAFHNGTADWGHDYGEDGYLIEAGIPILDVVKKLCVDYNVMYRPQDNGMHIYPQMNYSTIQPVFDFGLKNGTIEGNVKIEESKYEIANRFELIFTGNNKKIIGVANADEKSGVSVGQRQQYVCKKLNVNSLNPETQYAADYWAQRWLETQLHPGKDYLFKGVYAGLKENDVVNLLLDDGVHKCYVLSAHTEGITSLMTDYKLREVYA